jgi:DNA-binding transcriptional regulator PaaX
MHNPKTGQEALFNLYASLVGSCSPAGALRFLYLQGRGQRAHKLKTSAERSRTRSAFAYLCRMEYIEFVPQGGSVIMRLTDTGRRRAQAKLLPEMLERAVRHAPKVWDGKWRLILFDIPAPERVKRNAFRVLIRKLGATMLQKSVWAYPHDCTREMRLVADYFDLTPIQLRVVVAEDVGDDSVLQKRYKVVRKS